MRAGAVLAGLWIGASASAETGLVIRSFSSQPLQLNSATVIETVYVGQCPGVKRTNPEAWFQSESTTTAEGLRVKLENISPGMDPNRIPYADRSYAKGPTSEHTWLDIASRHRGQTFSVQAGVNDIQYTIKNGDKVVESGVFQVDIQINQISEPRYPQCTWRTNCYPTPYGGTQCRQDWECTCPF